MSQASTLDALLAAAMEASPGRRIEYRDALAKLGAEVIAPIAPWLADARLGAFAVRVLGRIGDQAGQRRAVLDALARGRDSAGSAAVLADIDDAITRLGGRPLQPSNKTRTERTPRASLIGTPGKPGRRYWAMHTWERTLVGEKQRAYIWAELQRGRMRQGWGWDAEQDLNVIARAKHEGRPLSDAQRLAVRAHPMLGGDDGMRYGDLVVIVGVPEWGKHLIAQVAGPYEFDADAAIHDYGHVVPVRLVGGPVGRYEARLTPALRHALNNRTRLWRIDWVGGDIEALLGEPSQ